MGRVVLLSISLALIGAIVAISDREPTSEASHIPTAGCESLVAQPIQPATKDDLVAGPVILRGALVHARRARKEYRPKGGRDGGAKMGLVLERGSEVIVSIHPKQRRYASLTYTEDTRAAERVKDGNAAVRFRSCFAEVPTGFPGGILLTGPRCIRLTLAVTGGRTYKRKIAFGRDTC